MFLLLQKCQVVNSTLAECSMPSLIDYVGDFLPEPKRKRRSLRRVNRETKLDQILSTSYRSKRQAPSNGRVDSVQVNLGVIIGSNKKYEKLGLIYPSAAESLLYLDPSFFQFKGVKKFRPFSPLNQRTITIEVRFFNAILCILNTISIDYNDITYTGRAAKLRSQNVRLQYRCGGCRLRSCQSKLQGVEMRTTQKTRPLWKQNCASHCKHYCPTLAPEAIL